MYSQLDGYIVPSTITQYDNWVYYVPFAEVQPVEALFPYELLPLLLLLLLFPIVVLVVAVASSSSEVFIVASSKLRLLFTLCWLGLNSAVDTVVIDVVVVPEYARSRAQ